jgi:hypothetical protein
LQPPFAAMNVLPFGAIARERAWRQRVNRAADIAND